MRATFAAGCFWGVEASFSQLPGVLETQVGYTGGEADHPSYEQVCRGATGHAEAVQVEYDPERISYRELLEHFFQIHDATLRHKPQYRSALFLHNEEQEREALAMQEELLAQGCPIVTEIVPAAHFYKAEEYHQKYFEKNR